MKINLISRLLAVFFIAAAYAGNYPSAGDQTFRNQINEILKEVPGGTNYGILVIEPVSNDTIFVHNASALMIPASVTKLYTTLSALTVLGPDYLLSTKLLSTDLDVSDGVINGDLIIKGYGNSLFTTDSLKKMVAALRRRGLNRITGRIIGDDSFFDDEYYRKDWIEDEPGGANLPPVSALVLDRNQIYTKKKIRRRKYAMVKSGIQNPPEYIAKALFRELKAAGVAIGGAPAAGLAPRKTLELAASSVRLGNLIKTINKRSDNFLAECLFKTMGAAYSRKEGSGFYAGQALYQFLERHDIITDGLQISDGSGLSHFNLVSVRSVVSLLEWAYLNLSSFDDFQHSLSIAGDDGTLANRMLSVQGGSNFFGKTGTLTGLSSIAGYLHCKSGSDLILAMIFEYNEERARYYKRIQDRIIELLAGYNN